MNKHSHAEAVFDDALRRSQKANEGLSTFEIEFVVPRITGDENVIPESDELPWEND